MSNYRLFLQKCVCAVLFTEHMNQTYLEFDEQKWSLFAILIKYSQLYSVGSFLRV